MNRYMTGEDIETIYREMELELISSMKRNLSRHLKEEKKVGFEFEQWQAATLKEFKRFQRENQSIIGNYTSTLDKDIQETFQNELKKGCKQEFSRYKKIMGDKFKESDNLRGSFFKLNDRKIKGLIKSTNNDFSSANKACFRMANDQFRKTIIKSVIFSNHGVVSPKKAIDMATRDFLSSGLKTVQYKDGRRVNIASYAKMAVRTGNQRAQLIGEGQFRKEIGEHLVQVTSHGGTCKLCSKWEGKILIDDVYSGGSKKDGKYILLSTAMDKGLFHPNCEHGLPTYYKELEEVEKEINSHNTVDEQYQDELNYINQNIYKYQRLEVGSLDEENIQRYKDKRQEWENKKQDVIKELNNSNYEDITQEYIDNATPNSHKVVEQHFFKHDGIKYKVDGKNVILDYSNKEKEVAKWLKSTFGGKIKMLPRINKPDGISTPDYLWKDEYWDLKEITGKATSKSRAVDNVIKNAKNQTQNIILDISNSKIDREIIINQVKKIYSTKGREWIDKIIVVDNNQLLLVYQKNKKRD